MKGVIQISNSLQLIFSWNHREGNNLVQAWASCPFCLHLPLAWQ